MEREYDIFECFSDGSIGWREKVLGLPSTRLRIDALVTKTGNDHLAMHLSTREVVFHVDPDNVTVEAPAIKRIFHIAYTERSRIERANLLRAFGCGVLSVIGNEAAKVLLSQIKNVKLTLIIMGHSAPEPTRKEMVVWLKKNHPNVKILALNPPYQQIHDADFNVLEDKPNEWLTVVSMA
jgi:hypothetical protein